MKISTRLLASMTVAASLLLLAAPASAQTITVSLTGSLSSCAMMGDDGPVNASVTLSAGGGSVTANLGGGSLALDNVFSDLDDSSFSDAVQALSQAGGSLSFSIMGEPLGAPSLCLFSGTVVFSLQGGRNISADAPGNLATTTTVIDSFVRAALPAISNRIRALFNGNGTGLLTSRDGLTVQGMAAGNGDRPPIGAWAGYSFTDTKNDFVTTAFTSKRHNVVLGVDTMPADNWIVGVSVALEKTNVNTRFNGGQQDITGISITPYVGYLLSDWLSVDAAFGVSSVQSDQFRMAGGTRISSDVESTRVFGNINTTGTWTFGALLASARAGLLYATQDDDSFRESNGNAFSDNRTKVGRFLLGGELAYAAGNFEPYVGATFEHDFTRTKLAFAPGVAQPKSDDSDVLMAVGLRYYGSDDLSGSVEYSTLLGRRNLDEDTISANLRWQF